MPSIAGSGVMLRVPHSGDFAEWAHLRESSRAFLTPWEPTWPADDLTRSAFRRRLKRYAEDLRSDLAYAFLIFRSDDDALVGGLTLANIRRGVAQAGSIGYWIGAPFARQGYMTAALRALDSVLFWDTSAAPAGSGLHSVQRRLGRAAGKDRLSARRLCARLSVHQRGLAGPSALRAAQGRLRRERACLGRLPWACHAWLAINSAATGFSDHRAGQVGGGNRMARIGAAVAAGLSLALALGGCGSTGSSSLFSSSPLDLFKSSPKVTTGGDTGSSAAGHRYRI